MVSECIIVQLIMERAGYYQQMEFLELEKVLPKQTRCWTVSDVKIWLDCINLATLYPRFRALSIDGSCLGLLDPTDLQDELQLCSRLTVNKIMGWVRTKFAKYDRYLQQKYVSAEPPNIVNQCTNSSLNRNQVFRFPQNHIQQKHSLVNSMAFGHSEKQEFDPYQELNIYQSCRKLTANRAKIDEEPIKRIYSREEDYEDPDFYEEYSKFKYVEFNRERNQQGNKYSQAYYLERESNTTKDNRIKSWERSGSTCESQNSISQYELTICEQRRNICHKITNFPFAIGNTIEANLSLVPSGSWGLEQEYLIVISKQKIQKGNRKRDKYWVEDIVGTTYISHNREEPFTISYKQENYLNQFRLGRITYTPQFVFMYSHGIAPTCWLVLTCQEEGRGQQKIRVQEDVFKLHGKPTMKWYQKQRIEDIGEFHKPIVATITRNSQDNGSFLVYPHLDQAWRPMTKNCKFQSDPGTRFLMDGNILEVGIEDQRLLFEEELECVICCGRARESVLLDCGHNLCCMRCARDLDTCPLCRKKITDVARAYKY